MVGLSVAVLCTWKKFGLVKSGLSAIEGFASSFSTNDLVFDFCRVALPLNLLTPFDSIALTSGKEEKYVSYLLFVIVHSIVL